MNKIIIASGPVIVEGKKTLLDISGKDNFWKFCGGRIKDGETLIQTAKRRAKEELGIDIEIINKEPFLMLVHRENEEETTDAILVHFLSKRIGKINPGPDIKKWEWIDLQQLPTDNKLGENIKPTLKHFGFID